MRRPFADFTAAREPLISCFIFEFAAAYSSASISDKTNESRVAKPWRLLGKRVPHLLGRAIKLITFPTGMHCAVRGGTAWDGRLDG